MYYLGCPMWANPRWQSLLYGKDSRSSDFLTQYCQFFNSVEGNTTFYADPDPQTVQRWLQQTPSNFRFMFKVPQTISHQHADATMWRKWLTLIRPLQSRIGLIHLQLPASFGPAQLKGLEPLLECLSVEYRCAVEIRHLAFFDKGVNEQALHHLLRRYAAERVCFDSRALFSVTASDIALQDAQKKKPYLPVHVKALTDSPVFRFIGLDDLAANRQFYQPWLLKTQQWLQEGKTPFAFFHTPDNRLAPLLARQFATDLAALTQINHPVLGAWPADQLEDTSNQLSLFGSAS